MLARQGKSAPARLVHLGLGNFFRAHQAWYTAHAPDAGDWGIAAFSSFRPDLAETLSEQDCLYTLVERGDAGDRFEVIDSVVQAWPGSRVDRLNQLIADPAVGCVTLTITEVGYQIDPADAAQTPLGRLVHALDVRRRAGGTPIALVPCDNLPDNAAVLRTVLLGFDLDADLRSWIEGSVSVVGTSVDRITPQTEPSLEGAVLDGTGLADRVPVVTEPFTDWVLSGEFPAGRPQWDARFVDDIRPWQTRKLWMLNGAHSLMAAAGPLRGHRTVAEAIADVEIARAVERLWDEDLRQLPEVDGSAYRQALLDRFRNRRIEHRLDQIARDAEVKLTLRIGPVAMAERAAGRNGDGASCAIGAWAAAEGLPAAEAVQRVAPTLAADEIFTHQVDTAARHWSTSAPGS